MTMPIYELFPFHFPTKRWTNSDIFTKTFQFPCDISLLTLIHFGLNWPVSIVGQVTSNCNPFFALPRSSVLLLVILYRSNIPCGEINTTDVNKQFVEKFSAKNTFLPVWMPSAMHVGLMCCMNNLDIIDVDSIMERKNASSVTSQHLTVSVKGVIQNGNKPSSYVTFLSRILHKTTSNMFAFAIFLLGETQFSVGLRLAGFHWGEWKWIRIVVPVITSTIHVCSWVKYIGWVEQISNEIFPLATVFDSARAPGMKNIRLSNSAKSEVSKSFVCSDNGVSCLLFPLSNVSSQIYALVQSMLCSSIDLLAY